ncbi:MAG: hypothetical protein AB1512_16440 [Thermodesulfobacteriota bacterium]
MVSPKKKRKRPPSDLPLVTLDKKGQLSRLADTTRWMTRTLAGLLALIFAWLKLEGLPLPAVTTEPVALLILRLTLVLYYSSWVLAVMVDTRDFEDAFVSAPHQGKIPARGFSIAVFLSASFGLLCWVQNYRDFVLALALFWVINILGWRYIVMNFLRPAIRESRGVLEKAEGHLYLERISVVDAYVNGGWQSARFIVGALGILLLAFLCFSHFLEAISRSLGFLSSTGFMAIAIAFFVLFVETWIWFQRIRRRIVIRQLERLSLKYFLFPSV